MEDVRKHGFFREELMRAINEHPTMVTATRRVLAYLALATHNGYGGSPEMLGACFPSNKKIIEALGYSRQTITKAIKDANENYGLGVRQYRKHGRKGAKYYYDWEEFFDGAQNAPDRFIPDGHEEIWIGVREFPQNESEGGESPQPEGDESTKDDNNPTDLVDTLDDSPSDNATDSTVAIETTEVINGESSDDEWRDSYVRTSDAIEEAPKQSLSNQAVD
jgi:hypothetical protein